MKTFTIKKGKHYSNFAFPKLFFKKKKIVEQIIFDDNCRYDLQTEDQLDTNKLFGIGYLPWHHYNSVRFGWRYDLKSQQIEILAYWYKDKVRYIDSIAFVDLGKVYTYSIERTKTTHKLSIFNEISEIGTKNIDLGSRFFGYFLKPYFGGNRTAPHLMTIRFQ